MLVPLSPDADYDREIYTPEKVDEPLSEVRGMDLSLSMTSMGNLELVEVRLERSFRLICDMSITAEQTTPNVLTLVVRCESYIYVKLYI